MVEHEHVVEAAPGLIYLEGGARGERTKNYQMALRLTCEIW